MASYSLVKFLNKQRAKSIKPIMTRHRAKTIISTIRFGFMACWRAKTPNSYSKWTATTWCVRAIRQPTDSMYFQVVTKANIDTYSWWIRMVSCVQRIACSIAFVIWSNTIRTTTYQLCPKTTNSCLKIRLRDFPKIQNANGPWPLWTLGFFRLPHL